MTAGPVIDIRIFYSVTGVLALVSAFSIIMLVIVIVQCCQRCEAAAGDNEEERPIIGGPISLWRRLRQAFRRRFGIN